MVMEEFIDEALNCLDREKILVNFMRPDVDAICKIPIEMFTMILVMGARKGGWFYVRFAYILLLAAKQQGDQATTFTIEHNY